ncbi:hypothetical protein P3W85_01540, partial [Cupriavidus basilensis]
CLHAAGATLPAPAGFRDMAPRPDHAGIAFQKALRRVCAAGVCLAKPVLTMPVRVSDMVFLDYVSRWKN